jgi:hypothetical protein
VLATLGPDTANQWGASEDSHSHQSHLCVGNMTPVTAANNLDLRLRGFRVPAVVIDAPLSVRGCVRLANKLPAARGPATHATSRGLVRSCRPRRRNRAVSHRAASHYGHFDRGDGVSWPQPFNCGSLSFFATQGDVQHPAPYPVTAAGFGDYTLVASRTARS